MKWWQTYSNTSNQSVRGPGYEFFGADGSWIREVIWSRSLQEDKNLFEGEVETSFNKEETTTKLKAKYQVEQIYSDYTKTGRLNGTILVGDDFALVVSGRERTTIYIFDLTGGSKSREVAEELGSTDQNDTHFYVLIPHSSGFTLEALPGTEQKVIESNYSSSIIKKFKKAALDLRSEDPIGRIVIINGEPGTGKTYLVRGLIYAAETSKAIIIPPNAIERLTEPAFITTLMDERASLSRNVPLVLIIEDADSIIQTRMSDNMPAVSALLNISEGIVGEKLNIRVIATTNAKRVEIDPAILRPGRLSQHLEVGKLTLDEAKAAMQNLGGNPDLITKSATLAEVYKLLKDKDEVPNSNADDSVGFML